jgi:hypothetical protein
MQPVDAQRQALDIATDLLREVRQTDAVYLRNLVFSPETLSAIGTFRYPRSCQFPNPDLTEVTGGQLTDAIGQIAYSTAGLLARHGVDIFGIDFDTYRRMMHRHRVNYVEMTMRFERPCRIDDDFQIEATLERFPDGNTSSTTRSSDGTPTLGLVNMRFEGRQAQNSVAAPKRIFTAHVVACCRHGK